METETLDQDALNLTKAIRQHESGGNFEAKGKSGEYGAYQFTAPTWKGYAKEVLGDENAPMTKENQNQVAYKKIKKWKDSGKNVGQIASMWNAGEGRPDAYKEDYKGVNEYGVHYDTPAYAKAVAEIYQQTKGQVKAPTQPTQPIEIKEEESTLGQELSQRGEDIATGISSLVSGKEKTGQNRFSGLLQTVGGVAGGLGDVVNKGLELIPGVKQVENLIGQGVGSLLKTETGQKVAQSIKEFSEKHPELSKDIGAGVDILTAIPILKGLGVVKNIALDSVSSALKGVAEKSMTKTLTEIAGRTVGGRKLIASTPEVVETLIKERAVPDIIGNKLTTKEATSKISRAISDIDKNKYQPLLDKASYTTQGVQTSFMPLKGVENKAIKLAQDELKNTAPITEYFERLRIKYGETPAISDLNKAKRLVSKNISEAGFASPTYSTDKIVRSALQEAVEEGGKALGIPDIAEINQLMARLIKSQNLLKVLDGKPIKSGLVGNIVKNTATVGGELAGNATGIPFAGALVGRGVGSNVGKKLTGGIEGILKRTGKDAERVTRDELQKKLGLLFGGAVTQKVNQKSQNR